MVGCFLFVILLIRHYALIRLVLIVLIVVFWGLIAFFSPSLQLYREDSKSTNLFGNVDKVLQDNVLLRIDGNSTWRLILWYRLTVDEFPRNIWGLGFGTPLIPYKKGADTADSDYNDEHDAHVIGAHNTYVTLLARLGILYIFVLYGIYTIVFKEFYRFRAYYVAHQEYSFFIAFFTISIIGLFNLVLESPIYAGLYWFFLGTVAKSIFNRQFANESSANS
ncbi:O-antigen ligase family protein [Raineya orbicola]